MRCLGDTKRYEDSPKRRRKLRRALLSVYYHSVGREFEVRGAPSVFLPPEIDVMSLQDALAVIAKSPQPRLNEALWRIVQNIPLPSNPDDSPSYPPALYNYFDPNEVEYLTILRRSFRNNSGPLNLTLTAARENEFVRAEEFSAAHQQIASAKITQASAQKPDQAGRAVLRVDPSTVPDLAAAEQFTIDDAAREILKFEQAPNYLESLLSPLAPGRAESVEAKLQQQLSAMSVELEMDPKDIIENLADIAAFRRALRVRDARLKLNHVAAEQGGEEHEGPIVYPVKTLVRQDTKSLAISATVTTIVHGKWEDLIRNMEPANWAASSDIVERSRYVRNPLTLEKYPTGEPVWVQLDDGRQQMQAFLDEVVAIAWDESELQRARYRNVLNVEFWTREATLEADVNYSLCRSIKSSILWDRGPGGMLADEGYIKLRPLGKDVWRVTMHKEVAFGDQAGSSIGSGIRDLSRIISVLAPVAITYWLEWEMYSLGDPPKKDQSCESNAEKLGRLLSEFEKIRVSCGENESGSGGVR